MSDNNDEPDLRESTCTSKYRYNSRYMAIQRFDTVYKCPFCRRWHGTTATPKTKQHVRIREEQEVNHNLVYSSTTYSFANNLYIRYIEAGARVKLVHDAGLYEVMIK